MSNKTPLVLLAGRTNVGKSALFNRIIGEKKSIVLDRDGVTRDWIEEETRWDKKTFRLADIGGIEGEDVFSHLIQDAFQAKLEQANVVVFVCDIVTGPTEKDQVIAKNLRMSGKKVILVANKADDQTKDYSIFDFMSLGFGKAIATSAVHSRRVGDLLDQICQNLPSQENIEHTAVRPSFKICIVGKPNTGKSSLLNQILGKKRAIVSDIEGTTREAIVDKFVINGVPFQLSDTAGVRRKSSVNDELETMMVKTSMEAIRCSNLAVILIDGSKEAISCQELKIISYAIEQEKAIILVVNKLDLMDEHAKEALQHSMDEYAWMFKKFPVITISCKDNKNIGRLKAVIVEVWQRCVAEFNESEVEEIIKSHMIKRPIYKQGQLIKIWKTKPIYTYAPTFQIRVNKPELIDKSHIAYIENILRSNFDLLGCPVKISVLGANP